MSSSFWTNVTDSMEEQDLVDPFKLAPFDFKAYEEEIRVDHIKNLKGVSKQIQFTTLPMYVQKKPAHSPKSADDMNSKKK